jgi:hypothetical protein
MAEIPNSKHQIPNKFKIESSNDQNPRAGPRPVLNFGFWALVLVWDLEFGISGYRAGMATWTGVIFSALEMSLGSMRTSIPRAPALM